MGKKNSLIYICKAIFIDEDTKIIYYASVISVNFEILMYTFLQHFVLFFKSKQLKST